MATREYCSSMAEELAVWSEKLHKLSSEIDRIPSIDKHRLFPQIEGMHILMTELDDRLCDLMMACPTVADRRDETRPWKGMAFQVGKNSGEQFDYEIGG